MNKTASKIVITMNIKKGYTRMKKLLSVLLTLTMLVSFSFAEGLTGGWNVKGDTALTPEAVNALETATSEMTGIAIEPVCILGTQLVAGTNYAILCRLTESENPENTVWVVAFVYADLNGGAELLYLNDIPMGIAEYEDEGINDLVVIADSLTYDAQIDFSWHEDGTQEEFYAMFDGLVFVDVLRTPAAEDGSIAGYSRNGFLNERYGELGNLSVSAYELCGFEAERYTFTAGENEDSNCFDALFFDADGWTFHVCVIMDADAYNENAEIPTFADELFNSIELVVAVG